jgi:microcystin degradation protein MlrC
VRVAVGGLIHETHTFAASRTGLSDFREQAAGQEIWERYGDTRTSIGGVLQEGSRLGLDVVPTFNALATPSGLVTRDAFENLAGRILDGIAAAEPLDGVILCLHGAMVAEGYEDAEGELLRRVRELIGQRPLVVTLDLHGNISRLKSHLADALVAFDTYPHVDAYDRAVDATRIMHEVLAGQLRPASALAIPPLMPVPQGMDTSREPMKSIIAEAHRIEADPRVINVSVFGGFAYSDVEFAGFTTHVTTNGNPELAAMYANQLAEVAWTRRNQFEVRNVPVAEAVRRAAEATEWPVVLVDVADNIGAGTPGDGTEILAELLARRVEGALVTLCDPEAVALARAAGVGAVIETRVGGKSDRLHGQPVPVRGRVRFISDGEYRHVGAYMTGKRSSMGRTVVLDCGSVELVITELRVMPFDIGYLEVLGIKAESKRVITVKSAIAWQTAFGAIAQAVIPVDTAGLTTVHLDRLPFQKVRRPVFPLDRL